MNFLKNHFAALAVFGEYFFRKFESYVVLRLLSLSVCFVNKLDFFCVSNRSRYLVDRYIAWTDLNNLKYSVGVESLVRHGCW